MYRALTATDFKKHFLLPPSYKIEGFLVYGAFSEELYSLLKDRLNELGKEAKCQHLQEFLEPILEFEVSGKKYWFTIAYGGARLSEFTHLAALFGSKKNIILGYCGGLIEGAVSGDIVMPTYSFGDESSTRAYSDGKRKHYADKKLRQSFIDRLSSEHKIWEGPTTTYHAMLAETWEDITQWMKEGYYGVDMETSTVLAVSSHFNIPAASVLVVADNLIQDETVLDKSYKGGSPKRKSVKADLFDAAIEELIT